MQCGLRDKADVAMAIAAGDLSRRVEVNSPNDHLGNAIDRMTMALQSSKRKSDLQDWNKTGKNGLNRIIVDQDDLKILTTEMLNFLASYVQAQIGTLYVKSEDGLLTLTASHAVDPHQAPEVTIAPGRGVVGQAAAEKRLIQLSHIPTDYMHISSSLGDSPPCRSCSRIRSKE